MADRVQPLTAEEIPAVEASIANATEGPWEIPDDGESVRFTDRENDDAFVIFIPEDHLEPADRRFIEAARVLLPRALAGNRAWVALVERIEQLANDLEGARCTPGHIDTREIHSVGAAHRFAAELRALLVPPQEPSR